MVLIQSGSGMTAKEMDATTGAQKQRGVKKNRPRKTIICFCCRGNHPVFKCDDIPLDEREKIMATKKCRVGQDNGNKTGSSSNRQTVG